MAKTIYCPKCESRVASHDGKSKNVIEVECRKCWKIIVYTPETDETKVKDIPPRTSSSGVTFR